MASSTKTPGTFASEAYSGSTDAWANPSNAGASDNVYATAAVGTSGDKSEYLKATGCGFAIPANAAILGIEVLVEWSHDGTFSGNARKYRVRVVKGATVGSDSGHDTSATLSSSDATDTFGSSTDLWGETWTPDDINASGFGAAVACQAYSTGSGANARVDRIQVRVYYQPTTGVVTETEGPVPGSLVAVSGADADIVYGVAFTPGQGPTQLQDQVRSVTVRRGRSRALDRIEAGSASVGLVDLDGDLDPSNASGAHYGSMLPLRDVYVYRRANNITYWLHRGRVERYLMEWAPPSVQFTGIESADYFELLSTLTLESDQAQLTTALAGSNNDLVFTSREAGEAGEKITVSYVVAGTNTALAADTTDPLAGSAVITAKVPDAYWKGQQLWAPTAGRQSPPVTVELSAGDVVFTIATDGGGAATSTAAQVKAAAEANPDIARLLTVAYAPGNDGTGVVTAMAKTALSGGKWPQESSGARINRVLDLIGWPEGQRAIDPGLYDVVARGFGAADNVSALAHILDVAEGELGYVFVDGVGVITFHDGGHRSSAARSTVVQATFSDDGTGIPYTAIVPTLDKERIVNKVTVTGGLSTSIPQTVIDSASKAIYNERPMQRSTQLANDADALAVANALLASLANPMLTFDEVSVVKDVAVETWDASVFGLELGDLVAIRTNPPAHDTSIEYQAFVEEIELTGSKDLPWSGRFRVSAASQSTSPGGGGGGGGDGALLDSSGDPFTFDSATAGVLG